MGFAAFGAKPNPPKKKRKIAGAEADNECSGSNNTPLGKGAGSWHMPKREREGKGGGGVGLENGGVGNWEEGCENVGGGKEGCGKINGGGRIMPLVDDERFEIAGRARCTISPFDEQQQDYLPPRQDLEEEQLLGEARERSLRRLEQMGHDGGIGKRLDGEWDWNALRRGVRDERGDMAFYDASFVEDPWRGLLGDREGEAATRPG